MSVRQWVCVAMRLLSSVAWEGLRPPEGAFTRDAGIPISSPCDWRNIYELAAPDIEMVVKDPSEHHTLSVAPTGHRKCVMCNE